MDRDRNKEAPADILILFMWIVSYNYNLYGDGNFSCVRNRAAEFNFRSADATSMAGIYFLLRSKNSPRWLGMDCVRHDCGSKDSRTNYIYKLLMIIR